MPDGATAPGCLPRDSPTAFGVIDEARRRRRRRNAYGAVLLVLLLTALAADRVGQHSTPPTPFAGWPRHDGSLPATASPGAVFAEPPYLGVACHAANSVACERVGLAVWLRRPAIAVSAAIGAHTFPLDLHGEQRGPVGRASTEWAGFLHAASLFSGSLTVYPHEGFWAGNNGRHPEAQTTVRFLVHYADGQEVQVTAPNVSLRAGYG
jgi:hypothetical protein